MPKRSGDYGFLEELRQKVTMSQQIAKKDGEYSIYAGGDFQDVKKIAQIDLLREAGIIPEKLWFVYKLYRDYFVKKRKAYFATLGSDVITKLGFILGYEDDTIRATNEPIQ
jgi:hypothetical protein